MQSQELKRFSAWVVALMFATSNTWGAVVDLADAPLAANTGEQARPNVHFIFDDSSSMPREFMPDNIPGTTTALDTNDDRACFRNIGYNSIYYNPATTYVPPVGFANASSTAARTNGFNTSSSTTNLQTASAGANVAVTNSSFATTSGSSAVRITLNSHGLATGNIVRFTNTPTTGTLRGIPWTSITNQYLLVTRVTNNTFDIHPGTTAATSSGNASGLSGSPRYNRITLNSFYTVHRTNPSSPPVTCDGNGSYEIRTAATHQAMGRTVAEEWVNYANWYSYYRSRLLLMKTASGRAFEFVSDKYRVGFSTTSEAGTNAARFLGNKTFEGAHRTAWYNLLYGVDGDFAGTPLRGALSRAGRYYAGRLGGTYSAGGVNDPVQYACQRNFTILTTDGFWNTFGESTSGTRFGPYREDNLTPVGDQDGGASVPRPYRDDLARSNTLADVAMYYFNNDLRTSGNGGPTDEGGHVNVAGWGAFEVQNMYTFTLGLGVTDSLSYPNDLPPIGDAARATSPLMQGTKSWPAPGIAANGTVAGGITEAGRTDDLWHAAENGRGRYISAANADQIVVGLNAALADIESNVGSSAAAATSNLQPVQDDNTAFVAQFETVTWVGNLVARTIDVNSGVFSAAPLWESKGEIDAQFAAGVGSRNIYTFDATAANKLRAFTYDNLTLAERAWFNPASLSQAGSWNALTQLPLATSQALVNFLRGDTTLEGNVFRDRANLLGDIVNAAPVYVRKPPFSYLDPGYAAFATANTGRAATVYVGANDGMLHAINADTGRERWAYMPSMVLPNLKHLADENYSSNHRFYVDGPITVGDAYDSAANAWKTILVAGLGKGGKGFFALDVTNPSSPQALWEFGTAQDADIGYSFGNAMITKRARDGRWVAIFSSGYNNGTGGGDARGRIYVVDVITGEKLDEYITGTTNDENLSGIGRAANLVPNGMQDNTTRYVYAGDLRGSLWRFDINENSAATAGYPSTGVQRLGQTHATDGAQPITVRPELARIQAGAATYTVVYFGTGRFLGVEDIGDPFDTIVDHISTGTVQAIYAVKDTGSNLGVLADAGDSGFIEQNLVVNTPPLAAGQKAREITSLKPVDWYTDNGWFVKVPAGERFNVNPGLQNGVVVMAGNIVITEDRDRCNPQGASVLYQLDFRSGKILRTDELSSIIVGFTQLQLGGGAGGPIVINVVQADGSTSTIDQEDPGGAAGAAIRVSWREIE